jgi:hypothetical protein
MTIKTLDLQKLHELELLAYGPRGVPGTIFQRFLVDNKLLKEFKVKVPRNQLGPECKLLWSLAVGYLSMPKVFFYGLTPDECLEKAWKAAVKKADKARTKFVKDTLEQERKIEADLDRKRRGCIG